VNLRETIDLENGENCIITSVVHFTDYYNGDKIREDEMKGTYGANWEMNIGYKHLVLKP
jgi:hypothetical protein